MKGTLDLGVAVNNAMTQKGVVFKNNAPFRSCISKINNIFLDNSEDFDNVILVYNLLEYSDNYSMTSKALWNNYRDEVGNVNDNASETKSF